MYAILRLALLLKDVSKALHVLRRNELVLQAREQQDGRRRRDERNFGGGVPFLVTEEREGSEQGEDVRDELRERCEGVFKNESGDLGKSVSSHLIWNGNITCRGLRLARSMDTAPPIDWPNRICSTVGNCGSVDVRILTIGCFENLESDARKSRAVCASIRNPGRGEARLRERKAKAHLFPKDFRWTFHNCIKVSE